MSTQQEPNGVPLVAVAFLLVWAALLGGLLGVQAGVALAVVP